MKAIIASLILIISVTFVAVSPASAAQCGITAGRTGYSNGVGWGCGKITSNPANGVAGAYIQDLLTDGYCIHLHAETAPYNNIWVDKVTHCSGSVGWYSFSNTNGGGGPFGRIRITRGPLQSNGYRTLYFP